MTDTDVEWRSLKLGDVLTLKRGYDLPQSSRKAGSVPVYSSAGLSGYHNEAKIKGPGVITGRYGTLGEVFFTEEDYWPHNTTLYVRDFKGNDPKFIYYFLQTLGFANNNDKTSVPGINRNDLHEMTVTVPSLQKQRQIASILSSLDEKIELNRQTVQTLEAIAQALFKEWFVDYNFPGATGEMEEGIPKGWNRTTINKIAGSIQYGYTQSSTQEIVGPKFLRITDIQGGTVNWADVPYCKISNKDFEKYQIKEHDILIARTGASTGENIYIVNPPDAVFASYLIRVQFENSSTACYVGKYLRSKEYFEYIASILSGSAQPNANAQQLTTAEILFPDSKLLEEYFKLINPLDQLKARISEEIQTINSLRDSLLPKLMKGEIKV